MIGHHPIDHWDAYELACLEPLLQLLGSVTEPQSGQLWIVRYDPVHSSALDEPRAAASRRKQHRRHPRRGRPSRQSPNNRLVVKLPAIRAVSVHWKLHERSYFRAPDSLP